MEAARGYNVYDFNAVFRDTEHLAITRGHRMFRAQCSSKLCMFKKMPALTMHRNSNQRTCPFIHLFQLSPARMARDVNITHLLSHDFNTIIGECVLKCKDTLLIPRNNFGREYNNIAFMEFHITMFTGGYARERGARFTLRACAKIKHMGRWHRARIIFVDNMADTF